MRASRLSRFSGLGCIAVLIWLLFSGCQRPPEVLPVIGNRVDLNGDSIIHKIRPFKFVSQLGDTVTNEQVDDKMHIVDFFFTSCPSICPKVTKQMQRIYDANLEYTDILFVSHTIDPVRDSPDVLKRYAENLNIDHARWLFLTGPKDSLMTIANEDYFIAALEAPDVPGGFDHSGKLILLDKNAKIRAFGEGTDPESVDQLMDKIEVLRRSYEK